ncbi:MAG: PorP/SprF family type IX secretion system membrane protein [Crocinitomicaceae bacterium]|nr:PorP/SprF family type IX secretion system membrane protein [Crocinitomicaceae bacterium]
MIKNISLVMCFMVMSSTYGQDIHFSQFGMALLHQNPTMAGAIYGIEATLNYKDQWRKVGAPYQTFAASYSMRLGKNSPNKKGFFALGANFFSDKAGDSKMGTNLGGVNVAYHIYLNRYNTLGAGINLGLFQRTADFSSLQWGNQFDGQFYSSLLPSGENEGVSSFTGYNSGAGFLWTYKNDDGKFKVTNNNEKSVRIGCSVNHFNHPKYSFTGSAEKLPLKLVAHGGAILSFSNTNFALVPGFIYMRQGSAQEINIGSMFRYLIGQNSKFTGYKKAAAIYIGAFYRVKDAITANLLLEYGNWGVGISYDINTSKLVAATKTRGGMELSLRFVAPNPYITSYGGNNSRF